MELDLHDGWIWGTVGLALLIAEIAAPGFFLIFLGVAAIATGLFTLLFDLGLAPQLVLFVIYTALAILAGKRWYAEPGHHDPSIKLNDPARRLVGKVVTVVDPVDDHGGRVKVGDSEWSARGGPAAVGERVTVHAVEGNCLIVERLAALPSSQPGE